MKILLALGGSGLLLGGLYASGAPAPGRIYDMPYEQAYAELSSMPVPGALIGTDSGSGAPSVVIRRSPRSIGWQFQVGGHDVALFTVRLSPEGPDRTRVRVEYSPGEDLSPELRHLSSAGLIRELARLAMSEQVEAQLEHRPVDQDRIVEALARHAAAHPEQIREFEGALGQTVAGLHRQVNENAPEGSASAAAGSWDPAPAER
jgi:hypothetical protein